MVMQVRGLPQDSLQPFDLLLAHFANSDLLLPQFLQRQMVLAAEVKLSPAAVIHLERMLSVEMFFSSYLVLLRLVHNLVGLALNEALEQHQKQGAHRCHDEQQQESVLRSEHSLLLGQLDHQNLERRRVAFLQVADVEVHALSVVDGDALIIRFCNPVGLDRRALVLFLEEGFAHICVGD